jgi:hypothetical protein
LQAQGDASATLAALGRRYVGAIAAADAAVSG